MKVNLKLLTAQIVGMFVVIAAALFLAAGGVAWPAGWAFLVLFFGFTLALSGWLLRHNPELLTERMTGIGKPDQKTWDKVFFVFVRLLFLAWLVLMPLDAVRFQWSRMPGWLQAVGAILLMCSFYLFFLTFRENAYLFTCRSYPNRARANGRIHWTLSLCAPSNVCHFYHLHGWHNPLIRVIVWATLRSDPRHRDSTSSGAGGTHVARRTARLQRVYGTSEIPSHPLYLVAAEIRSNASATNEVV